MTNNQKPQPWEVMSNIKAGDLAEFKDGGSIVRFRVNRITEDNMVQGTTMSLDHVYVNVNSVSKVKEQNR